MLRKLLLFITIIGILAASGVSNYQVLEAQKEFLKLNYSSVMENVKGITEPVFVDYLDEQFRINHWNIACAKGPHWEYKDETAEITIDKEDKNGTAVFVAHLKFKDFSRFKTVYREGTAEEVAKADQAILVVNGDVASVINHYLSIREGQIINDGTLNVMATYSSQDGLLRPGSDYNGNSAASAVASGLVTDTFSFLKREPLVLDGVPQYSSGNTAVAQRTSIGTNGEPGDITILVSSGRYVDDVSPGLTQNDTAEILAAHGCKYGIGLDGGGSSVMVFQGKTLVGGQRGGLYDFIEFK